MHNRHKNSYSILKINNLGLELNHFGFNRLPLSEQIQQRTNGRCVVVFLFFVFFVFVLFCFCFFFCFFVCFFPINSL